MERSPRLINGIHPDTVRVVGAVYRSGSGPWGVRSQTGYSPRRPRARRHKAGADIGGPVTQDQAMGPPRSKKRPDSAPGSSVARRTIASVPSVTDWGPLWALRSVAV